MGHATHRAAMVAVSLLMLAAVASSADPDSQPAASSSSPSAVDMPVSLPTGNLSAGGTRLPVSLTINNSGRAPMRRLRVATNQVFDYQLDLAIAPGETRNVPLAPWHYEGPLNLRATDTEAGPAAGGFSAAPLNVRQLPPNSFVLLFDREALDAAALQKILPDWSRHYGSQVQAAKANVYAEPATFADLSAPLLKDSALAGLVISDRSSDPKAARALAAAAGLDLWTIGADGRPLPTLLTPPLLRRLAERGHIRPDVFDLSREDSAVRVAPNLFQYSGWPPEARLQVLTPAIVMTALLILVGLLGYRLPTFGRAVAVLVIAGGGLAWTVSLVRSVPRTHLESFSVLWCDGLSGRTYTESLAAISARQNVLADVSFRYSRSGPPRPLMSNESDRVVYQGATLRRDLTDLWSVTELRMRTNMMAVFEVTQWDEEQFQPRTMTVGLRDGQPEVQLQSGPALADACVYLDGKAYRLGNLGPSGVYRPQAAFESPEAAAYAEGGPADHFRRVAMRWVGRWTYRSDLCLLMGWQDEPPAAEGSNCDTANHGRLTVWLLPRAAVNRL